MDQSESLDIHLVTKEDLKYICINRRCTKNSDYFETTDMYVYHFLIQIKHARKQGIIELSAAYIYKRLRIIFDYYVTKRMNNILFIRQMF